MGLNMQEQIPTYDIKEYCSYPQVRHFKVAPFSDVVCTASEFESLHKQAYYEIIWLSQGSGTLYTDLLPHAFSGSVLFLLSPGQIHQIVQDSPAIGYVVKFLPSIFQEGNDFYNYLVDTAMPDEAVASPVTRVPAHLDEILRGLFVQLEQEFLRQEPGADLIVSACVKMLITYLNRIRRACGERAGSPADPSYTMFRSFKVAIERHFRQEHAVQWYADLLRTQPRTLNTLTRKYAQRSAGTLIQDRIILEAQRSLYHEPDRIKELGYKLGFDDPAYFTRFFKKHTGLSPQQFKQHAKV